MDSTQIPAEETPIHGDAERGSYHSVSGSDESKESESIFPGYPVSLRKSRFMRLVDLAPYISLMLVPITFLVLAVFIWRLRDQTTSSTGEKVLQATGIASTLWPIAFAAVVGSTLATLALHTAERGVALQTLELLSSSSTLVSTLKACINLRYFNVWTIVLLVLWSLSPAGGQAVLRSLSIERPIEKSTFRLAYFPATEVGIPFDMVKFIGASGPTTFEKTIRTMFGATLYSPNAAAILANGSSPDFKEGIERLGGVAKVVAASTMDNWGNVRMPYLELLPNYDPDTPHGWVDVPTDQVPTYESLVGTPVRGIPLGDVGNITFPLSTVYTTLQCSPWYNTHTWAQQHPGALQNHQTNDSGIHNPGYSSAFKSSSFATIFMDVMKTEPVSTFVLGDYQKAGSLTVCAVNTTYIDAESQASSPLRRLSLTMADTTLLEGRSDFIASIPFISGSMRPVQQSPLEAFLTNPTRPLSGSDGFSEDIGTTVLTKPPLEVFQARLTVMLNTILRISFNNKIILGTDGIDPSNKTGRLREGDLSNFGGQLYENRTGLFGNTTGQWSNYSQPIYHLHKQWFFLYVASIAVLFLCVVDTIILRARICAPDFLGSVSALTRDSPYFDIPPGSSALDAMQLARVIGKKRVRIGDVDSKREVGKIAFAEESSGPHRLTQGPRLYM